MPYPVLVTSPLWLPMDREPMWSEHIVRFDSGARQADTPWWRPLYNYGFSNKNIPIGYQSSLHNFFNERRGRVEPFLMKDPYAYLLNGVVQVRSGIAVGANSGFFLCETHSWRVLPDSSNFLITSALSGALSLGSHFLSSLDNGFITMVMSKQTADTLTVSGHYFRKVAFTKFAEQSFLWQQFNGSFALEELMP